MFKRIEKNITRDQLAEQTGVAVSNIVRFEQKGLISLRNLISLVRWKNSTTKDSSASSRSWLSLCLA